jgi:hypothetical protein
MEYDKIKKHSTPPRVILECFYRDYISPYLKRKPSIVQMPYLYEQGYLAMRLRIDKSDIKSMLFVQWICEELQKSDTKGLAELLSAIFQETHDSQMRTEVAERNAYESASSKDKYRVFGELLRLYKALYENEFRLWSTIPYFYICKTYRIGNSGSTSISFVQIGAGTKFHALRDILVNLPQGAFNELVSGFDNEIRNAGEGHDSWEVTDNNMLLLNVINPKSGKSTGSQQIIFSEKEFAEQIEKCRKSLWILTMGIIIFTINNPETNKNIQRLKSYKLLEIKREIETFAGDSGLQLTDLKISEEKTKVKLGLKYKSQIIGSGGSVFIGFKEAYDVITITENVKYKYQAFRIMQFLVKYYFEPGKAPEIELTIFNDKDICVGDPVYKSAEIEKLFLKPCKENEPLPFKGNISDEEYLLGCQLRVPYGSGETIENKIRESMKSRKKDDFSDLSP